MHGRRASCRRAGHNVHAVMNRQDNEPIENAQLTTVLNRLRPTVVVRRRVYEVAREHVAAATPLTAPMAGATFDEDDDEDGPPSSVNVARALAHLRADELHRLEEILSAQDEEERVAQSAPTQPAVPTLRIGPAIAVAELARRMAVSTQELVTALVTRGFFDVTFKSTLTRETARAAAWMFGWVVEDDDNDIAAVAPPKSAKPKRPVAAAKAKAKSKSKAVTKTKPIAKSKAKVGAKTKVGAKPKPKAKKKPSR